MIGRPYIWLRNYGTGLLLVLCLFSNSLSAQQEWGYTQYLFNLYDINSAYAGSHGAGSFGVRYRSQWIGMAGAPETQYLSFHTPLFRQKMGGGFKVMSENIGARNLMTAKASAAYRIRFESGVLSLGIGGGVVRQSLDISAIKAHDQQDVQLQSYFEPSLTPVIDAAIFFNSKRFYAGVESGRVNRSSVNHHENSLARLYYNLNVVGGYMLPIGNNNILQLSGLMRYSEGELWRAEVNLLYLVKNRLWFGGGYRLGSNAHVMACFNFSERLRIGVSYDISATELRQFNDGSAEVFLGFNFKSKSGNSIRYF